MYLLVIVFPFLGFLFSNFFGRFIGSKGASFLSTLCMFFTVFLSFFIFYEVGLCNSVCSIKLFYWVNIDIFLIKWGFYFDSLTCIMLIVINVVSFLVHIFSINYMSEDPHLSRFMSYLSLFTFFMLILVTGDNFVQMFVGWEGVGLASYLLINFWFTRHQANKSAIKAIIVNRIGDFGLIIGICCIFFCFWIFRLFYSFFD
jgi:NADH-ubiquinone oxidoreductase chain 5